MPKPLASGGSVTSAFLNDLTGVIDRVTAEIDVVNTVTETTLYTKSVAANDMSIDRMLRLHLMGDYLNNTGAAATLTVRVKFGGTTIWGDDVGFAAAATRRDFSLIVNIGNLGAANVQFLTGRMEMAAAVTASVAGIGRLDDVTNAFTGSDLNAASHMFASFGSNGTAAIDTTTAQTLAVTVQHGAANASLSMRRKYGTLELL